MSQQDPEHLLVRARGDASPLYATDAGTSARVEDFTRNLPVDAHELALPDGLVRRLTEWNHARPGDGFEARPALRKHVKRGLDLARLVAGHLGPRWTVRFWDERRQDEKFVCWGCDRFHWTVDAHDTPPHPLDITVEGEYGLYPLHAEGLGSFAPDDPAAALRLSDDLVAAFHRWKGAIETTLMNDDSDEAWQRLFEEGRDLSERLARETGPARTVTYRGIANGGLAAMTSVSRQGDQRL
ncbi:hypothetical protein KEF29_38205 [Streptomyces tuirus]|uniref:Uncharacterized protein n=1 Tax=Streptomyces tuirus TaxID=68278 RepID=A0A941FMV4_9ACTN|nr:hypothetical protein [Streptomyces tuirus]